MRSLPKTAAARHVTAPLLLSLALGCQANVEGDNAHPGPGSGGAGAGGGQNLGGGVALPPGTQAMALLPARIRRLTVAEYQATVSSVIGASADHLSDDFVPDSRQGGFTVNEAQRVDPVFARQIAEAASTLGAQLKTRGGDFSPCADPAGGADACARGFIRAFGQRAYRRPLADDEVEHLMTVFHAAFDGGSYEEGIELTVRAMLQSAAFLYHTEIGEAPAATVRLTPYELASSISYLAQGGPPSQALVDLALSGELDKPEGRATLWLTSQQPASMARGTLFTTPEAGARVIRVLREWLGVDKIGEIAKDSNIYGKFTGVKQDIEDETSAFITSVVAGGDGGSLSALLAADWSAPSPALGQLYSAMGQADAASHPERLLLPNRRGILNQSAFLSVFAHAHETAPVLRGVAVMRRVACIPVADPVDLSTAAVPPPPDPNKTTRARFAAHATPVCAGCHNTIDSFGFAFEGFDGMGLSRDKDNNQAIDSHVVIAGTDFDGSYASSNELALALSKSQQVRDCFARHVFHALAGSSVDALKPSEDEFVSYWKQIAGGSMTDASLVGTLSAYIQSPSFNYRRVQ